MRIHGITTEQLSDITGAQLDVLEYAMGSQTYGAFTKIEFKDNILLIFNDKNCPEGDFDFHLTLFGIIVDYCLINTHEFKDMFVISNKEIYEYGEEVEIPLTAKELLEWYYYNGYRLTSSDKIPLTRDLLLHDRTGIDCPQCHSDGAV